MEIAMNINALQQFHPWRRFALLSSIVLLTYVPTQAQKSRYACQESQPETLCNAANTCAPGSTCTVDIRRSRDSVYVKPSIPNAKNNQLVCIKVGTPVVWMTSNGSNGFMVSFGTD
jgi:hypothetical protein